jgi:hypothetical protein
MAKPRLDDPLTADQLRAVLDYDPATGVFTWRWRADVPLHVNKRLSATPAGHKMPRGHIQLKINWRSYRAHRLAWLWITGEWPAAEIDHIDGNPSNNAWINLRVVSRSQNMMNSGTRRTNTSGAKGVWFDKQRGLWRATITIDYVRHNLGWFPSVENAKVARDDAAQRLHGKFARAN